MSSLRRRDVIGSTKEEFSGTKRTIDSVREDSSGEIRTKVKKSELETKGVNEWDLPNDLAKYINTYMTTHKSRKEVSEE